MSKQDKEVGSEKGSPSGAASWHLKPGDKVVRRPRIKQYRLRRVLGVPALFATGYGNVGSSIYYALGMVVLVALGATPIVLAIAGVFFILIALTYAEGTTMLPEAGGSASFARHGFNNSTGFIAGWALLLSYIVTISISAFVIPPYLSYFWPILKESPAVATTVAMGIVLFLTIINIVGVRQASFLNVTAAVMNLVLTISIIVLGLILLFNLDTLIKHITVYWPTWGNLVMGVALAAIAYTGVETISQMAEETKQPGRSIPRAFVLMVIAVLILFGGISSVAISVMTPTELAGEWATDPIAGIASRLADNIIPEEIAGRWWNEPGVYIVLTWIFRELRDLLAPVVAILAAAILVIATNAGLLGISRLAFSLGRYDLVPAALGRVHPRFKTPYLAIALFGTVSIAILIPGFFGSEVFMRLGVLYAFGSLLSFAFAHASILALRARKAELPRPFKIRGCIKIKGKEMPITAVIGLLLTLAVWLILVITQPYSRWVGFGWMALGLIVYSLHWRRKQKQADQPAKWMDNMPMT